MVVTGRKRQEPVLLSLRCVHEKVLAIETCSAHLLDSYSPSQYCNPTYRMTTGECPNGVLASPFALNTNVSKSTNSLSRGCLSRSAKSAPAELINSTFCTPAFFAAAMSSAVISYLSVCAGGIRQIVSQPMSFRVLTTSRSRPGL